MTAFNEAVIDMMNKRHELITRLFADRKPYLLILKGIYLLENLFRYCIKPACQVPPPLETVPECLVPVD